MRVVSLDAPIPASARWALAYATVDAISKVRAAADGSIPLFGCTSFQGVFTPDGFPRGAHALIGEEGDPVADAVSVQVGAIGARSRAADAARALREKLGTIDALLLHATPGFEERILEGIADAFDGSPPQAYGGSAADDDISGKWRVFHGPDAIGEGFVLAGFRSDAPVHGSFVAGYNPGRRKGKVTAAAGRVVRAIDGRPAAEVYDEWLGGKLGEQRKTGGVVLGETTLHPLGRAVGTIGRMTRYLLSHPHRVERDGSMALFTDVAVGDELVLMVGSRDALFERTDRVAGRASRGAGEVRGGVLIYCGGCVGVTAERTAEVSQRFGSRIDGAPFVGAATFGEVGCFDRREGVNRHGNLMADAILFE
ncbi:MAG: FIST C-terminal domain-containing protein [Deltaproteobacteria bacterium]|nr:FIST C-terminal domain-containing protein [Deltaproteobacteria bacterium]